MSSFNNYGLNILLWLGISVNQIYASEHSPGVVKPPVSEVRDTTEVKQPNSWLRTFFESFFDSNEDDTVRTTEADTIDWDEKYRTSNQTDSTFQKIKNPPQDGIRVGSVCMDNFKQELFGRGACSGRGGVRFWIYKTPDSDALIFLPTQRHFDHPQDLNQQELMQLDAHHPFRKNEDGDNNYSLWLPIIPMGGILQLLVVIILCVTVLKTVSLILKKNKHE
ncbi:MAG: hypothetical protein IPM47_10010 [Sphingobacteriales bacterium]|nr:MAG: hypothetical protein IPM47_10010 [Sphingobacteriales bacterium]